MDKLKEALAVAKEQSFWIMCGGILLVSLGSWWYSTGKLKEAQTKYKGEIESAQSTIESVRSTTNHPNDSTSKGMDAIIQAYGEDVLGGWQALADAQQQVLIWPDRFDDQFKAQVIPLRPIETKVGDGTGQDALKKEISTDNRRLYREYISDELPTLADMILSKWQVDRNAVASSGMSGMAGGPPGIGGGGALAGPPGLGGEAGGVSPGMGSFGAAKEEDPSIVVSWNPANQREITGVHFGFTTSAEIPSTLQVLYAQEDLWVFQNLMGIIKSTNGDATRKHEAAIKYIDHVSIGRSAGDVDGQVTAYGNASVGGGMNTGGMMQGGMMPTGGGMAGGMNPAAMMQGGMGGGTAPPGGGMTAPAPPSGSGSTVAGGATAGGGTSPPAGGAGGGMAGMMPGMGTTQSANASLGSGRYVDKNYASIVDIKRLVAAMNGTPQADDMLLAVAKRMPVRMQLTMDQRKLAVLLANCGNSKLPVEVRQVRINKQSASGAGGGGGMQGMMGMAGMGGENSGSGPPTTGAPPGGGGAGMMGMMGGMMGGTMGGASSGARPASSIASSKEDPNEISVEIYGIVYIYNPPDRKLLGIPEPAGTAPATTPITPPVAPVTTPASTTPAKATPPITAGAAAGR